MNTPVTVTFVPEQIITWLIIGLVAGFLASIFLRGRRYNTLTSIIIGLIGAVIGGFLFNALGIVVSPSLYSGITIRYIDIIVAFIGAIILLLLLSIFWRRV